MDHFSLLPETLTTNILSLLPLKDAVRTSVLSHSWINKWRTRLVVEINEADFQSLPECLNFTHQWLIHYPHQKIQSFSLTLSTPPTNELRPFFNSYIGFAISHEATSLELNFPNETSFELPTFLHEYEWLDELKLFSCNFTFTDFENIGHLTTLSLGRMSIQTDALTELLRGCPLIKNLSLVECDHGTAFVIFSMRIQNLVIDRCVDLLHLTLITPHLKTFKYIGALIPFGTTDLGVLDEADLDLGLTPYYDHEESGDTIQEFLMKFRYARVLKVCTFITQVLAMATSNSWRLLGEMRAKYLTFKSAFHHYEYIGIGCILSSCSSLEKLQFDVATREIFEDDENHPCVGLDVETFWVEDFPTPGGIRNVLQEVEINGFGSSYNELQFLKFMFHSGLALRTVRLRIPRDAGGVWRQVSEELAATLSSWRYNSAHNLNIVIE